MIRLRVKSKKGILCVQLDLHLPIATDLILSISLSCALSTHIFKWKVMSQGAKERLAASSDWPFVAVFMHDFFFVSDACTQCRPLL